MIYTYKNNSYNYEYITTNTYLNINSNLISKNQSEDDYNFINGNNLTKYFTFEFKSSEDCYIKLSNSTNYYEIILK